MTALDKLDVNQRATGSDGHPTPYFEDEWERLQTEAQSFTIYDDLADAQANIPNPVNGQKAAFSGQGAGYFDESIGVSGTWVKSSDGTTAII